MVATDTETARAVVTEYFEAMGAQDLDRALATWEPGAVDRIHGFADLSAPEGIREYFGSLFEVIPDFRLEAVSMVAEGDDVAVRWRATGSFDGTGKFEGFAPNGRSVELEGLDLLTVRDGRIVGNEAYTNGMEFARQIGALPPQGSPAESAMAAAFNAKTALVKRLGRG